MVGLLFCAYLCSGSTIVVDAYASGWYDQGGYSFGRSGSNLVGLNYSMGIPYRFNTFYIFTIPALGADVAGVTFHLELAAYHSEDAMENILLSGVRAPVEELVSVHTIREGLVPWIYNDLMDGPEYGVLTVEQSLLPNGQISIYDSSGGKGPTLSCELNGAAVEAIGNSAGGTFVIGLSSLSIGNSEKDYMNFSAYMGDPDYRVQQLEITMVPEPASLAVLVCGLCFIRKRSVKC